MKIPFRALTDEHDVDTTNADVSLLTLGISAPARCNTCPLTTDMALGERLDTVAEHESNEKHKKNFNKEK